MGAVKVAAHVRLTRTERADVRYIFHQVGVTQMTVWENDDGTWAGDVHGNTFDAPTAAGVLRYLADVLEES